MKTVIIIPARYASSRLPGKPLLRQSGKYLVQHVYERARQCRGAGQVIVATDDSRIAAAVRKFGGQVAMTRRTHASGTDRVAEVAARMEADVILNVQGDEPLIDPRGLELLLDLLQRDPGAEMATLAVPIRSREQWQDPNCVKVVCDGTGRALYFSRSPIPYVRDGQPDFALPGDLFLQHLGVYAYRRSFLMELAAMPAHPLEGLEKLEQLRVLAAGRRIKVGIVDQACRGVDTYEDYAAFLRQYRQQMVDIAA